jgi:uncharacterized protein DUF3883
MHFTNPNHEFEPTDREYVKLGYDIENRDARAARIRFLEVKGPFPAPLRLPSPRTKFSTHSNMPDDFILAIIEFLHRTDL